MLTILILCFCQAHISDVLLLYLIVPSLFLIYFYYYLFFFFFLLFTYFFFLSKFIPRVMAYVPIEKQSLATELQFIYMKLI